LVGGCGASETRCWEKSQPPKLNENLRTPLKIQDFDLADHFIGQ
jgi:hypothetical protein